MIAEWDKHYPGRSWNVFGALTRVVPSHLMDKDLFDFVSLKATGQAKADGDIAFDTEQLEPAPTTWHEDKEEVPATTEAQDAAMELRRPRVVPVR